VRDALAAGIGDYTPIFLSEVPEEFEEGRIPIDVALISVAPPDHRGQCSLGVSVDIVRAAAARRRELEYPMHAKAIVFAGTHMPTLWNYAVRRAPKGRASSERE